MTDTKAALVGTNDEDRGLFESVKESASDALDFFAGVDQSDVANGRVDLNELSREDRIQLLVDGSTSSIFGSSPWSVGRQLDPSVATLIHESKGGALAFLIEMDFLDVAQSALRSVRYALVWDDTTIAETGTFKISALGKAIEIVAVEDVPQGRVLTLWVTDDDLNVRLLKQGPKEDVENLRKEIVGEIKADKGDSNGVTDAIDDVFGFLTATQIGGVVVLVAAVVALVFIVRSESFKDVAAVAAKAVK